MDRDHGAAGDAQVDIDIRNISGRRLLENDLPSVRFGGGFVAVATHELTIRLHNLSSASRPIFFDAAASGQVVYSDGGGDIPWKGMRLRLSAEVKATADGYVFVTRAR